MTRDHILEEIKRTSLANLGIALGQRAFESETGITTSKWRGRYWRTWSDAVKEAGFEVHLLNRAHEQSFLILSLVQLTRLNKRSQHMQTHVWLVRPTNHFLIIRPFHDWGLWNNELNWFANTLRLIRSLRIYYLYCRPPLRLHLSVAILPTMPCTTVQFTWLLCRLEENGAIKLGRQFLLSGGGTKSRFNFLKG